MTDTITVLTVRLPLCPDAALSPNSRGHWRAKAAAVKELRRVAYYMGIQCMWSQDWATALGPVTVRATIGWAKGRKRHDGDNSLSMLKPVFDGFSDAAIWVDDSQCRFEPVTQKRDPDGRGYIEIAVEAC